MKTTDSKSWQERRKDVQHILEGLALHFSDEVLVEQLVSHVSDEKWEIRKIVAEALLYVHPERQFRFSGLLDDTNKFVRNAAESSMKRAGVIAEEAQKKDSLNLEAFRKIDRLKEKGDAKIVEEIDRIYRKQCAVMLSAVGHDIRNVLLPIVSSQESALRLLEKPMSADDQKEVARLIGISLDRSKMMNQIADDIRTWGKPTPAARRLENLGAILQQAHAINRDYFRSVGMQHVEAINIAISVPGDLCCYVARESILRVFQNLIKNACEAFSNEAKCPKPRAISVSGRKVSGGVEIDFTDNGRGMSHDELTVVRQFSPCGISKKSTGTGLGMAIACAKVRDHGGEIKIKSKEDVGTTVTVLLPDKGEEI